ncbi:hypothetical protein Rcae01_06691 [Novipirellula caenicola]|uniref:Uncharacterized protein n=1 Tax=Novipirellula caenicola TaxID=1536901 RepID=A0ABP9W3U0_9BACT
MVAERAWGAEPEPVTGALCVFPDCLPMRLRAVFFAICADRLRPHSW